MLFAELTIREQGGKDVPAVKLTYVHEIPPLIAKKLAFLL